MWQLQDLKSETSGDYRSLLLALMMDPVEFAAAEAQRAVKGLGTDDRSLIEVLCTRTGYEMRLLKEKFQEMFGRSLADAVKDDTSGDYRRLLLALIEGERNDSEPVRLCTRIHTQTHRHTDTHTDTHTHRQTDRQTDRDP